MAGHQREESRKGENLYIEKTERGGRATKTRKKIFHAQKNEKNRKILS